MDPERRLDRRSLLLAGAGLLAGSVAACSADDAGPRPERRTTRVSRTSATSTTPSATPSGSPTTPPGATTSPIDPGLPATEPWSASRGDLQPAVKLVAARVVEAIGSWPAGLGGPVHAAARLRALGQHGRLAGVPPRPLHTGAPAAALQVIEAQYGGLLPSTASVLVVCRQWHLDAAGQVMSGGTTVDVRLARELPRWRVTAVHPGLLPAPARPVPALARAVLAEPRIDLPPAARADIASGAVHANLLSALLELAKTYRIGVSVVRSGHPTYVFGTDRVSDHAQGRAFDTWRIDGHPVVDPSTPRSLVAGYLQAVADAGSYNVGGPFVPTGGAGRFFTNAAHHDHVHAGFAT